MAAGSTWLEWMLVALVVVGAIYAVVSDTREMRALGDKEEGS